MSWRTATTIALGLGFVIAFIKFAFADVMGTATWDMTRAAGFTAYVLLWAAVVGGMAAHMQLRPKWLVPTWLIESHRMTSVLALSFVVAHILALLLDEWVPFTLFTSLVPFQSDYRPLPVGLGIIALWLLVFVLASTALSGFVSYRAWKRMHYLSFPCWVLALVHGITAGSDTSTIPALAVYASTSVFVAGLFGLRVSGRRAARKRAPAAAARARASSANKAA
jgi:sulfoxide reductase heme-binding subunit YedZ